MAKAFSILLAISLLGAVDAHLPVLQVFAWSGMLVKYSRTISLRNAIHQTFDGQHPCRLCCAIKKAKSPPKQELSASAFPGKLDWLMIGATMVFPSSPRWFHWPVSPDSAGLLPAQPAVPPPRFS